MNSISRKARIAETVVFVDGLPGCGKTLFSPLIATMERVELLSYAYEVENYCSLYYLGKMPVDAAKTLIRIQTDLKIYNTMMGRDVNFRPTDLSSALKDHNPARYFQRLFTAGDETIPDVIRQEKPILNLAVHNLLSYSEPIWQALGDSCIFVEVVRHPLYMVRQQALNMENLLEDVRDFTIYYSYKGRELPYYVHGWEELYLKSKPMERVVHLLDQLSRRTEDVKKKLKEKYHAKIITVPFERFVLEPNLWIKKIAEIMGTKITESTIKVMRDQNVPRDMVGQGLDLDIYRRCGWVPPTQGANERDELLVRRDDVANNASADTMLILDRLCKEYEMVYWNPDNAG